MRRLLPWRLGVRAVTRNRRASTLLAILVAIVIATPLATATLTSTASVTAAEVATISMGQADVQVRTTTAEQGRDGEGGPVTGQAGITRVIQDVDVDLVLEGPTGQVGVLGRLLPFRDPLAAGILVSNRSSSGEPQLALSHVAMTELGVGLGDRVSLPGIGASLEVTDVITFAPDTRSAWAIIDPSALSTPQRLALLADGGSIRWLVQTGDLDATLTYLDELDLRAGTRASVTPPDAEPLVDPALTITVFSLVAILVLAGGGTAMAGFHRRQSATLLRLGADIPRAHRPILVESTVIVAVGAAAAVPLGIAVALLGRWWGQRVTWQLWGPLEVPWVMYLGACLIALLLAPLLAIASSRPPQARAPRANRRRTSVRDRRVTTWLLGARLARQRGSAAGTVGVGAVVAVGAAAILVMNVAAMGYTLSYQPQVPGNMVFVGLPRPLTAEETRALTAGTDTTLIEDRRATFWSPTLQDAVPVVLDSPITRCTSDPASDFMDCYEGVDGPHEYTVATVDEQQATGFLGRELTSAEATALATGDGLLLTPPESLTRLVPYGGAQADATTSGADGREYDRIITPLPVTGFSGFEALPGLLISPATLERWGLEPDPTPISHYLLTATAERPTEETVRAALPAGLVTDADLDVDETATGAASFAATERAISGTASALVFLIVTLLVLTWAADASATMTRLARLGASRGALVRLLLARGIRVVGPAVVVGAALTPALVWGFSRYALITIPITGWLWLAPALAAVTALPIAAFLRVRLAPADSL